MPPEIEAAESGVTVVVETPAEPAPPSAAIDDALRVAQEIAKSDAILAELRVLYSVATGIAGRIDALEYALVELNERMVSMVEMQGAILAAEVTEPEATAEAVAETVEEVVTELVQEEIPASKPAPETAPPEEKKTRRRGFF